MSRESVERYHDGTKHHFHAFARSLGYLDWASQPNPFRSFHGAPAVPLPPAPGAPDLAFPVGPILRHALGLTAWKSFRPLGELAEARWSLRANPSSGNLHPTEAYVVLGPLAGLSRTSGVYHYAPDRHALERRCAFDAPLPEDGFLVALTSIHWREAWKYGERAFRYCQHDLGHAIAAITVAASQVGWHARLLPDWRHEDIARLTGVDRAGDYIDAEAEEPGCVLAVASHQSAVFSRQSLSFSQQSLSLSQQSSVNPGLLIAISSGQWSGRASQLSEDHVQWTFIDEVALATRAPAFPAPPALSALPAPPAPPAYPSAVTLKRRSAVAFDARSTIDRDRLLGMLARTMPDGSGVCDVLWWTPRVHLALFVHRVVGLDPGLYLLLREPASGERLKAALGRAFEYEPVTTDLPLVRLARGDCRALARRLSCDQDIAGDGFFSLGMIADFEASLAEWGPAFYRHLFWETGVIGQVLYLEAEAAGARATGIGCFYDDPVHGVLGLTGHAFQSLYHFSAGIPVEDARLTTETGYAWEIKT